MSKPDEKMTMSSVSNITSDGFIQMEGMPPIDLLDLELDFKFGDSYDKFLVLMVMGSGNALCPECKEPCDDCIIMKTKRESDGEHCDIFVCKTCRDFSMSVQPHSVMISDSVITVEE
jgi:hypothetical protein|tara:strand:+ start:8377 stop:8727 length:351 start_codon:yes stop_codon:yes gene_type:complete